MLFPEALKSAIEEEFRNVRLADLAQAASQLSQRYRIKAETGLQPQAFIERDAHRLAYLAYRMPATYAVVLHVCRELNARAPALAFHTLLDLGAGPGTAAWAVSAIFPSLDKAVMIERDGDFISLGRSLAKRAENRMLVDGRWVQADLSQPQDYGMHDLVVLSYAIGELEEAVRNDVIGRAWASARKALIVIEPGTSPGFERVRKARGRLIELGAHLLAPCPHQGQCPMAGADWCHFSERLARSSLHRQVKEAALGFEDEKYSYVIAGRQPAERPIDKRILRHPMKHSGHISFFNCTKGGLRQETISRRQGGLYKTARKMEWGDAFEA